MATEIKCEKKVIREIFNMWYCIPDYQRAYVWDTDQVRDLLDDTISAYRENKEAQYFLGSMVLKINEKSENNVSYTEYELLDSQQRITTVFLILACMRDMLTDYPQYQNSLAGFVYQAEDAILQQPERMRIIFNIRSDVRDFVNEHIKPLHGTCDDALLKEKMQAKDVNISIRNMANAMLVAHEFLEENKSDIIGYLSYFLNKVLMIYVATEELQDAFQLFTVLNNRGVKLSSSDILKAENLKELSAADRTSWATRWEEMETYFGEDFDKFLSHIRTILVKKKQTTTLLKEFDEFVYSNQEYDRTQKKYVPRTPILRRGRDTFELLYSYYHTYQEVFDTDHSVVTGDYEITNYLKLMETGFGADYWIAPVLDYYRKYRRRGFVAFLKALDRKLSADWITAATPTVRMENVNAILREIEASQDSAALLQSKTFTINKSDFERVINGDIYGRSFAKYLLLKLDLIYRGSSTPMIPQAIASIEHILPRNPSADSQWVKDFSAAEREEWTNKLGNLVLISRRKNTSQGNRDYVEKKEKYFEKNIEMFPNSIRIYQNYPEWKLSDLKKNHSDVVTELLNVY
ncbi:putative uncharacterized protein [Firmicutes bacterium CAG:102]|nr:putative uncharacterized protein [Firmicutes bacterium CAG:102]